MYFAIKRYIHLHLPLHISNHQVQKEVKQTGENSEKTVSIFKFQFLKKKLWFDIDAFLITENRGFLLQ